MIPDARTRERLLAAGRSLFGEKGFRKVTVRELAREAGANVAAVNYHFGDKEGLYREVMQVTVNAIRETSEAARIAGEGQPPEVQLRRYIGVFLNRILRPGAETVHKLLIREMSDPTPALDDLIEKALRPRIQYLAGLVSAIMGVDPSDPRVMRCVGSIQSQAIMYRHHPGASKIQRVFKPTEDDIDVVADHIATFSLGGIRAVASGAASRGTREAARVVRRRVQRERSIR